LEASHYWALTGTPVQNKEADIYALLKFLHMDPFDDISIWRSFMASRKVKRGRAIQESTVQRLQAILSCLMLRRTKEELADAGKIQRLPTKHFELKKLKLSAPEQEVHDAYMSVSRSIFIRFLEQKVKKRIF
jgi:SNF2 family DNA or RNA helicase